MVQRKRKQLSTSATSAELDAMQEELESLRSTVYAAKIAYLNRTPFQDKDVSFEDLRNIASEYIQKNYAYQRARFGKIRVRISVAKLLR